MSELERYGDPYGGPEPVAPQPYSLTTWGDEFLATARISSELARTHFVPQSLWVWRERDGGKVFDAAATTAQVTAVIVTGQELGLGPMAALRSVDVINGTPALRAVALRAILLRHGHDVWVEESTNARCVVAGQRRGSTHVQRVTWTIEDARQRNLTGKPNWRTQPRNMLIARATGDCARLIAADAIMGIPYTAEELEDGVTGTSTTGQAADAPAGPGRRARRPAQIAVAPPDDDPGVTGPGEPGSPASDSAGPVDQPDTGEPPPPDAPPPEDPPPAITAGQTRRMHALIRQAFGDYRKEPTVREAVLTDISETVGRPIESTSALTAAEASVIIARWEAAQIPDPDEPREAAE